MSRAPSPRCTICDRAIPARQDHIVSAGLLHCRSCWDAHQLDGVRGGSYDRRAYTAVYGPAFSDAPRTRR